MGLISLFFLSFFIALSGALVPGPLLTATISQSIGKGFRSGPLIVAGHALAELSIICLMVLGLDLFLSSPMCFFVISVTGAFVLIYFGARLLLSLPGITLPEPEPGRGNSGLTLLGLSLTLANPYWLLWWLTIGSGLLISAREYGINGIIVFFAGHILADLLWYSLISLVLGKSGKLFSLKIYRAALAMCALALICFGFWFVFALVPGT